MWLFWAILSGILFTGSNLVSRHVLKKNKDAWAYSFFFSLVGALVTLPFFIQNPLVTTKSNYWVFMILVAAFAVLHNLLVFKANNYIEVSISESITKFRLVWIFILSTFLLNESFNWLKLLGTIFIVLSGILMVVKFRKVGSLKGIGMAFLATFVYAGAIISYKYLLEEFSVASVTFFVFFVPTILNSILMPKFISRVKTLVRTDGKWLLIGCGLGGLANLTMTAGINSGEVSKVPVIIEAFLLIALVGERLFLKEKSNLFTKLIVTLLTVIGAVLIKLA